MTLMSRSRPGHEFGKRLGCSAMPMDFGGAAGRLAIIRSRVPIPLFAVCFGFPVID
jgi:hypothetical protein